MITVSFRMKGKKIAAIALLGVVVIGTGFGIKNFFFSDVSASSIVSEQKQKEKIQKSNMAKNNNDRLEFIASFDWEVDADPIEVREIIIPKEFDNVYVQYNEMQKTSGYDLSKYSSKRCKRYAYAVTNYPDNEKDVMINLIVYKNKIIGGDVSSAKLDGFMHGFKGSK